jgi:hypothetical protein
MVAVSSRLERWIRRLDRTAEAIEWFVRTVVLVVLLVLLGVGLVWYSALEYLTPDPWSGPGAVAETFGWQVWAAAAAGITGIVGLFVLEYIQFALVTPVAVVSWILARFRPDDPLRRTVAGLPEQARALSGRAFARPTRTRSDLVAPLRAAARRPATWVVAAGGLVLAVILAVGVSTLLGGAGGAGGADRPGGAGTGGTPPTAAERAAIEEQVRAVAMEIHALVGAPPIREELSLRGTQCSPGDRRPGDPSRYGFGYLGTRPGTDPVARMPQWAADLRAGGWQVTYPYPVERRQIPDDGLLAAVRDGYEVTIDARDPPDLWIEVRGLC